MDSLGAAGLIGGLVGLLGAGVGILAVIWALGLIEYMGGKKKSSYPAVSQAELEKRLLFLNTPDSPYEIKKNPENDFILEWKIADAKWFAVLSKERYQQIYRGFLVLDEARHAARYCEELVSVRWLAAADGPPIFNYQKNFFRGRILFQKSWEVQYGIKEDLSIGKVYEYKFDVRNVRGPLQKVIQTSGWEFVPVTNKAHATHQSLKKLQH
jgi:hypothetical protein